MSSKSTLDRGRYMPSLARGTLPISTISELSDDCWPVFTSFNASIPRGRSQRDSNWLRTIRAAEHVCFVQVAKPHCSRKAYTVSFPPAITH